MTRKLILLSIIVVCFSCKKKTETTTKIADLQDRRATDSLLIYLNSEDDAERRAAALAFASVQDTAAIKALDKLNIVEAAFALGQMYDPKATAPLAARLYNEDPHQLREVYEAFGKVIRNKSDLKAFDTKSSDTLVLAGIAWGIYRAGVRGVSDSTSVNKVLSILADQSAGKDARLGAAQFFSRVSFRQDRAIGQVLVAASKDKDAEIRMAVVNALVKVPRDMAIDGITSAITDTDYRVRVNAARALRSQPWDVAKPLFDKLLNDADANVNIATAEVLLNASADTASLHNWAAHAKNWRTQATLYSILKKADNEVKAIYLNSDNDYQKAALFNAITDTDFIFDQFKNNQAKVIKSSAASRIADISSNIDIFKYIIADGDQGSIIPVCDALRDTTRGFKKQVTDYSFLEQAKSKLSLPRDYETYVPLERTLNYFKGLPPPAPLKNEYNHPIDWTVAASIAKDQHVIIETSKGDIVMRLFIDEAPGSVVNFVNLVTSGYFNGRFFHRVVPNFVIQTGCNRGDGFGSEDYSIRSEFSRRRYKTGSVGMASAGKDTEGTQWFITHSPTPHLDGKYTIFAEVVSGMDVVHKIEVGDKIVEARLIEY